MWNLVNGWSLSFACNKLITTAVVSHRVNRSSHVKANTRPEHHLSSSAPVEELLERGGLHGELAGQVGAEYAGLDRLDLAADVSLVCEKAPPIDAVLRRCVLVRAHHVALESLDLRRRKRGDCGSESSGAGGEVSRIA
jgi:hypothetical protein